MAVQTSVQTQGNFRTAAYLDFIQMLTGVGLILFMWSHMILVASINLGPGVMNTIAGFLEDTYLAQTGGSLDRIGFFRPLCSGGPEGPLSQPGTTGDLGSQ